MTIFGKIIIVLSKDVKYFSSLLAFTFLLIKFSQCHPISVATILTR